MKRPGLLVLLAALGCESTPPAPRESSTPPAPREAPDAKPADAAPKPVDAAPTPRAAEPAPLCVRMCELQGQARAVGPEAITRDCVERCEQPAPEHCDAFAKEARARVETVPMHERAAKVWAEIAREEFYCGYGDPLTRGLAPAATDDLDARAEALRRALEADPFANDTCPTGADLSADATAADALQACSLEEESAGWQDDVDAATYLAMRAVRLRLEASKLHAGDRSILLKTLLLSTALAREK